MLDQIAGQIAGALVDPFLDFAFMRRALVGSLALVAGAAPLGVLLMLRRMSLMGDALSHAVLPGAAAGFALAGLSLFWMSLGGLAAGFAVVLAAALLSRGTELHEDASLAALFVIALALGVALVARLGSPVDLLHLLFGSVLAVDDAALLFMAAVASLTLLALALGWRALALGSFDPGFLAAEGARAGLWHAAFLGLVVLNLVAAFQALGTLLGVGLMMVPAAASRFWARELAGLAVAATLLGALAVAGGLLVSFHADLPSGPAVILAAGALLALSVLVGPQGGVLARLRRRPHFAR